MASVVVDWMVDTSCFGGVSRLVSLFHCMRLHFNIDPSTLARRRYAKLAAAGLGVSSQACTLTKCWMAGVNELGCFNICSDAQTTHPCHGGVLVELLGVLRLKYSTLLHYWFLAYCVSCLSFTESSPNGNITSLPSGLLTMPF